MITRRYEIYLVMLKHDLFHWFIALYISYEILFNTQPRSHVMCSPNKLNYFEISLPSIAMMFSV